MPTLTPAETHLVLDALATEQREQRRRLARLAKSAGGRNHRSNEREQDRTRERIDAAGELRSRISAALRAEVSR